MSSDDLKFEWAGRALIALAAAVALIATLATGTAQAAPASGEVKLTVKSSSALDLVKRKGPQAATLPVADLELFAAATVRADGRLKFANGKRRAVLRGVILQSAGKQTALSAKLGKRRLVVFRARGAVQIGKSSASLAKAPLSLTGKAAKVLRQRLGLEQLAAGRLGTLAYDAQLPVAESPKAEQPSGEGPGEEKIADPYFAQCALPVTEKATGTAPAAAAAPSLTSPAAVSGGRVDWGFKSSFRSYVFFSGGALVPIAPAEVLNPPSPAPQTGSFRFPAGSGSYAINAAGDSGDDQAVVDGAGEVVLCNAPHGFRIVLSNPTVTIDGEDSRLTVDVDTNVADGKDGSVWTPTQRVDLATLDPDGVAPFYNEDAKTVTWSGVPANLTGAGEEVLGLCNPMNPGPCDYEEGDPIDPLTVELKTDAAVAWPFGADCTLGIPATASSWPAAGAALAVLPALTAPESIASGAIDWGVRNSLRATVNSNGVFNLAAGATRSDPTDMSGPGKFFTWPAGSGQYEAGAPGRLVLHGGGSVGICNTAHGYGTVLSNPTVVIDGAKSRLVIDVATRLGGSWTSGRVDLTDVATGGVEKTTAPGPGAGEETITWTFPDLGADNAVGGGDDDSDSANSSVKLAAGGTSGLNLLGGSYKTVGTALNKLSVSIVHPEPAP
jgi:hypothetical protein